MTMRPQQITDEQLGLLFALGGLAAADEVDDFLAAFVNQGGFTDPAAIRRAVRHISRDGGYNVLLRELPITHAFTNIYHWKIADAWSHEANLAAPKKEKKQDPKRIQMKVLYVTKLVIFCLSILCIPLLMSAQSSVVDWSAGAGRHVFRHADIAGNPIPSRFWQPCRDQGYNPSHSRLCAAHGEFPHRRE